MTKRLSLTLAGIVLASISLLLVARALAPTTGPELPPTVEHLATNLLSGTVTGLDPGDSARLQLVQLPKGRSDGVDKIVDRFDVVNGRWQQPELARASGLYRLVPVADGYVHVPRSIVFQVPEEGIVWRYTDLDFEFVHPADAVARLGLPLCPEPPSSVVPVTAVPEGMPSPSPKPESMPTGPCYANHLADVRLVPAGLQGRIGGLPGGQVATITLYALPAASGEQYGQGEPPPADNSWTYLPEVSQLAGPPEIASDWPLVATLRGGNGIWGLVDPSLVGHKYLVVADALGLAGQPTAYEVVIYSGKAPGLPAGVDFAFGP